MDEYARAIRAAEERGYQRGFHAGQNEAYNRGWREGINAARADLDRLTGEVRRLLSMLGLDHPVTSRSRPRSSSEAPGSLQ